MNVEVKGLSLRQGVVSATTDGVQMSVTFFSNSLLAYVSRTLKKFRLEFELQRVMHKKTWPVNAPN
jgi:hypothetical protein